MLSLRIILGVLLVVVWPFSDIVLNAQAYPGQTHRDPASGKLERTVNTNVKPGDDFFTYANGEWLRNAVLPEGKYRYTVRDDINDLTRSQISALLDDARNARVGTLPRKVNDFRAALLNDSIIELRGISPLKPTFDRIDVISDKLALTRFLGRSMRADVDPLNMGIYKSLSVLGLSVEHSIHGEKNYGAFLVQGGLALGTRDAYLSKDARNVEQRGRYLKYIAHALSLAGFDNADHRAELVLALETAIAETHATNEATANDRNADNQWSRATFAREAPGINWDVFFEAASLGKKQVFVAWQPSAVKGVAALVVSQPLESWKDYLRFHAIDDNAEFLPKSFGEAATGKPRNQLMREQRALQITQEQLGNALSEMYATRYFSAPQKARVNSIIANVAIAFRKQVANALWLSPASRKIALAKIDALYVGIGYPDRWENWNDLRIDAKDAFGNAQRIADRNYRQAIARLDLPYDQHEWALTSHTVGAVLIFQQNAYLFAAALLQSPKYDSTASDAATYGAIGALIGHDMSHFVDVLGADYQPSGRMHRWWTASDSMNFEAAAEPIVQQFSGYEPLAGQHIDGRLVRTENVADLAGINAAFQAYRTSLGTKSADREYVRRNDREFFIAFAQSFGTKMNEAGMRAQLANDHAPEMFRVNTVRNIDAWYDAFDVKPGDRLYLEPKARVRVW